MKTYGLEQEFFVCHEKDHNQLLIASELNLSHDDNCILAEARGEPSHDPIQAVYNLKVAVHKLQLQATTKNACLLTTPILRIPKDIRLAARRLIKNKGPTKHQNLYGYEAHKNAHDEITAGIHISFENKTRLDYYVNKQVTDCYDKTKTVTISDLKYQEYNPIWDFVQFFRKLDKEFAGDIKAAKRLPGFYEIKDNGRIEYRSLPTNTNLKQIADFLNNND